VQEEKYLGEEASDKRHDDDDDDDNNNNNNSNIPGNNEVKELQKTAILGTAHILRKVLM
jgi:hypothetical protein